MNPFISFCLYVAARVFVQYLKSRPKDAQVRASLQFLLSAMHAIKRKNPLTESFLVQLDVDLEGAGLDDSRSLRAHAVPQQPAVPDRSPGCPFTMGMKNGPGRIPVYGDEGLSSYNDPNRSNGIVAPLASNLADSGGYGTGDMSDFIAASPKIHLPNRHRTPGSMQGSATYRSPQNGINAEMDTSPDGSGDQRTPSSTTVSQQNASSHTSHTGHSPASQQQSSSGAPTDMAGLSGMFDHNNGSFSADFDMHNFPASSMNQQQGFVMPQSWDDVGGGTGFTPGPSGMTPGMGELANAMGLSDEDWNQVLNGFTTWDSGMEHDQGVSENFTGRRR